MKSFTTFSMLSFWAAAAFPVAAQYKNYTFTVQPGENKQFEGYLPRYGAIDLRPLTFSATQDSTQDSVFEVVVFLLPSECEDAEEACVWPIEVGVGVKLDDGTTALCCTQDLHDEGKCDENQLDRLITSPSFEQDVDGYVEVPEKGAWVHHVDSYYGRYEEYQAGKYVTLFANCNANGRPITVSGEANLGAENKPYDFFSDLHECGVPIEVNPTYNDDEGVSFELMDYLFDPVKNKCDKEQKERFDKALNKFGKCSGLNWEDFIETLPSAAIGNAIHCGPWLKEIAKWGDQKGDEFFEAQFGDIDIDKEPTFHALYASVLHEIYDLPGRVECENTLEGHNLFGETLHKFLFEPDVVCGCVQNLEESVPKCTIDTWPIPLVGDWMKTSACLILSGCARLDKLCLEELKYLDQYLIKDASGEIDCVSIDKELTKSAFLNLPQEILGAPLPDTCQRIAETEPFASKDIVNRYEAYRLQCDKQWSGWALSSDSKGDESSGPNKLAAALVPIFLFVVLVVAFFLVRRSKQRKEEAQSDEPPTNAGGEAA